MSVLWSAVLVLHLLSIIYWVGGGIFSLQMGRITRLLEPTQKSAIQLQAMTRYFRALCHVVPVALVTGVILFIHDGGVGISWPYHVMALCAALMAILFLVTFFGPFQKLRRALRPQPDLFTASHRRILSMTILGLVAAAMGAIGHFA
ncbi:hypothetical protein PT277_06345 [Acetobacteraceae bacterium ESL0709]|nr:hypothetical protein [Acetobacteraceae bacterium ESL0697]MDF7678316.1 hypothetical protein [Acetobacteraceae bacterium ESL0709]